MLWNEDDSMNKSLPSIAVASVVFVAGGAVSAQTTSTTTTWTTDQGAMIREYSTTRKYNSLIDPALKPAIGAVMPGTVTIYPPPETPKVPSADTYSYGTIINNPVVVERATRKVIHSWE